jgi:hypothetical protein
VALKTEQEVLISDSADLTGSDGRCCGSKYLWTDELQPDAKVVERPPGAGDSLYLKALRRDWTELRLRRGQTATGSRSAVHHVLGKRTSLSSVIAMENCQKPRNVRMRGWDWLHKLHLEWAVCQECEPLANCSTFGACCGQDV